MKIHRRTSAKTEEEDFEGQGELAEQSPILRGISFQIPAGKTVAIVGHSGSGTGYIIIIFRKDYYFETPL